MGLWRQSNFNSALSTNFSLPFGFIKVQIKRLCFQLQLIILFKKTPLILAYDFLSRLAWPIVVPPSDSNFNFISVFES